MNKLAWVGLLIPSLVLAQTFSGQTKQHVSVDNFPSLQHVYVDNALSVSLPSTMTVGQLDGAKLHTTIDNLPSSWVVTQSNRANLLGNMTLQLAGVDVSSTNPVPVFFPNSPSVSVSNWPGTQTVQGSLSISDYSTPSNKLGIDSAGKIGISNWPSTQTVTGSVSVSGGVTVSQATGTNLHTVVDSGSVSITGTPQVSVSNFPSNQPVSVSNFPTTQAVSTTQLPAALNADGGLNVHVTNPSAGGGGGGGVVTQSDGSQLHVTVDSMPSGSSNVTGTVSVSNFPATQPVSGTVSVSNLPATQAVSGTVGVSNFPATQVVSGTVTVQQSTGTSLHTVVDSMPAVTVGPVSDTIGNLAQVNVLNAASTVAMAGHTSASFTWMGTGTDPRDTAVVAEMSYDGGTTWVSTVFMDASTGARVANYAMASGGLFQTNFSREIVVGAGITHVRARISAFNFLGPGSTPTIQVRATNTPCASPQVTINGPVTIQDTDSVGTSTTINASASGTLYATVSLAGHSGVSMTWLGNGADVRETTIYPEVSTDGGTTWTATAFVDGTGARATSYYTSIGGLLATNFSREIATLAGTTNARVRVVFGWIGGGGGSMSVHLRATDAYSIAPQVTIAGSMATSMPPSSVVVALNAVTAVGASAAITNSAGYTQHLVQYTTAGSPTTVSIYLEGSMEGTNWHRFSDARTGSSGLITGYGAWPYVRVNLASFSGGTSPNLTAKYVASYGEAPATDSNNRTVVTVASEPSVGATNTTVPNNANYVGMNVGGTFTGLTGTANGLKVDGSAVTQPVSTGSEAATAAAIPAKASFVGVSDGTYLRGLAGDSGGRARVLMSKTLANPVNSATNCGTTITNLTTTAGRTSLCIYNNGTSTVYFGATTGLTTANGFPLPVNGYWCDDVGSQPYSCIVTTGTVEVRTLEN